MITGQLLIGLALAFALNVFTTIFLVRCTDIDGVLKTVQIVLVWAFPIFGALTIVGLHFIQEKIESSRSSGEQGSCGD